VKCIDTDLLVAILRGKQDAKGKMEELDSEGRQATSTISSFELFFGASKSKSERRDNDSVEKVSALLGRMNVLPLDYESSRKAGEIVAELSKVGQAVEFRDVLIAGISMTNGMSLVTRNREHFSRIKGLKLESW
jgi:tRNA(fMet)-specific endonuclease VapC